MTNRIIDAHSHIGTDSFHTFVGEIGEYARQATSIGVTDSLLMPPPSPKIVVNEKVINLLWKYNFNQQEFVFSYLGEEYSKNTGAFLTPYALANYVIKNDILSLRSSINFYFVPLVHPIFDSPGYIEQLLLEKPKAIKVHGIAAGLSPKEIPNNFFKLVKKYDVPIIVHTDYDSNKIIDSTSRTWTLNYLRNANSPINWIKFAVQMGIRLYLTHGVRLDEDSIHFVNTTNLFVVGIGPDSLIQIEPDRLYNSTPDYLKMICSRVSIDKLCFDLDYPWNVNKPISKLTNKEVDLDFDGVSRLKALGLTQNEINNILWKNAARFFGI